MPQLTTEMVGEICTIAGVPSLGASTPPAGGGSVLRNSLTPAATTESGAAGGATLLVIALFLQGQRLLTWYTALAIILLLTFLELLFVSQERRGIAAHE